ncbi:hypothetical protein [Atrimonas thermophila]|uniref:hypothetical protein n=1 Tax=Atrimonas thermophila TaxID=3064161 RepID=UPI00399D388C
MSIQIGGYELPTPQEYEIVQEYRTVEKTLVDGSRRFIKLAGKRTIRLRWKAIDRDTKDTIDTLNSLETPLAVNIENHSFYAVATRDPVFTRVFAPQELYSCEWELKEP